jgi:hypothetical protein
MKAMPRPLPRALLVLLPLATGAAACEEAATKLQETIQEKVQETIQENAQKAAQGASTAPEPLTEEELLARKLDLHVQCTNASRERIYDSYERYRSYIKEDGTPKRKGRTGIYEITEATLSGCNEAANQSPKMQPSLPELEQAQAEYTSAAQEYGALSRELEVYYKQENYKDDDWARGKEIAPRIEAAFSRWKTVDEQLSARLDAKKDEADARMLELIEQRSGKTIEYFSRAYVIAAKTFVRCVDAEAPDLEACEQTFAALEQANNDFRSFYKANEESSDKVFWMGSFESSVDDLYTEGKKHMRSLRAGKAKPRDRAKVIDEYNDLVRDANNLRFDFPR